MNAANPMRRTYFEFISALQFLTRIPMPAQPYEADSLWRAVKFFPVAGALVGGSAALLYLGLAPHLPRLIVALLVVVYLVLLTGGLHEDGLADAADGMGGGLDREQVLRILRDSRIGSYGSAALTLALMGRVLLLSCLPNGKVAPYLITAHVLCRWSTLPLSYFLPPARSHTAVGADGQGARIARLTSLPTLAGGTVFSFAVAALLLRMRAFAPILIVVTLTALTGFYYKRRIGGITGDCFGATNQMAEIGVYLCGAWL
jgi:adenosylcobinamide-GDP ribazoletransferase